MFTRPNKEGNKFVNNKTYLPCGWSKEGLQTFNELANEVIIDRKEHGSEFDNKYKERVKQDLANTYKAKKRKRHCVDTYSDLLDGEVMVEFQEHDDEDNWVNRKKFAV